MDAPTLKLCKQRITELSAKLDKSGAKAQGKVTEFIYRDELGRYHDDRSLAGDAAKVGGAGALALGGLYLRGRFPGTGRLRSGGKFRAPGAGLGGVLDTARLGAGHLAGDVSKLWSGTKAAGGAGKAGMQQLWRNVLRRFRA